MGKLFIFKGRDRLWSYRGSSSTLYTSNGELPFKVTIPEDIEFFSKNKRFISAGKFKDEAVTKKDKALEDAKNFRKALEKSKFDDAHKDILVDVIGSIPNLKEKLYRSDFVLPIKLNLDDKGQNEMIKVLKKLFQPQKVKK